MNVKTIGGFAKPCIDCRWAGPGGWCQNGASKYYDFCRSDGKIPDICPDAEPMETAVREYRVQDKVVSLGGKQYVVVSAESMERVEADTRRMGELVLQMGQMMGKMQQRMEELENRQAAVTICHREALKLMARMRNRADELCEKYGLGDPESRKALRAAVKKDVLKRAQIRDLHDLPESMLSAAERQIDSWTDIRLVMERRVSV